MKIQGQGGRILINCVIFGQKIAHVNINVNTVTKMNINTNSSARINMKIRMKNKIGKALDRKINANKVKKVKMRTYKKCQY